MHVYFSLSPHFRRIHSVRLAVYTLNLPEGCILICPCRDAELFSDDILRYLLVSEAGEQILAAIAVSFNGGDIRIKAESIIF